MTGASPASMLAFAPQHWKLITAQAYDISLASTTGCRRDRGFSHVDEMMVLKLWSRAPTGAFLILFPRLKFQRLDMM